MINKPFVSSNFLLIRCFFTSFESSTLLTVCVLFVKIITVNDISQIVVDLGKKLKGGRFNDI